MPGTDEPGSETILIVDDEPNIREGLSEALYGRGYTILTAPSGEAALRRLEQSEGAVDLMITDLRMKRMDGLELLRRSRQSWPATDVLVITAFGTVETAVEALKEGAYDFITKPIDLTRFRVSVEKVLERRRLQQENLRLRRLLDCGPPDLTVGTSAAIQAVYRVVDQVSATDATVLIEGASGTGKEVVAHAIHRRSLRRDGPLIIVNCGALPATLLENELFGHEREAFTGAATQKKGRFELADGGTLFLDEIAEMGRSSQAKFLRVLEDGIIHRVGGSTPIRVDVRVIAATNTDLRSATAAGNFREDLYYRLNVVSLHLPRLAERREDIPLLAKAFLEEISAKHGKQMEIGKRVMEALLRHDWPGNVRELRNAIERAVILGPGPEMAIEDLPPAVLGVASGHPTKVAFDIGLPLSEVEELAIRNTLEAVGGNRRKAAEILGLSLRALQYKLKEYSIASP